MNISYLFLLGLLVAFVGVIPPGLLNMTAAKISLKQGYTRAFMFSLGACVTVGLQTYLAVVFAKYLSQYLDVIEILKWVALVVFLLISSYFFILAKREVASKPFKWPKEPVPLIVARPARSAPGCSIQV